MAFSRNSRLIAAIVSVVTGGAGLEQLQRAIKRLKVSLLMIHFSAP